MKNVLREFSKYFVGDVLREFNGMHSWDFGIIVASFFQFVEKELSFEKTNDIVEKG